MKLSWPSTSESLLEEAWRWVDRLAAKDYDGVFENLGYAMAYNRGPSGIRQDIQAYRSELYFPGETEFHVTSHLTARGGNPAPLVLVRHYMPMDSLPIVATVELDLPLNGKWSDLQIAFVVTLPGCAGHLAEFSLEDIAGPLRE